MFLLKSYKNFRFDLFAMNHIYAFHYDRDFSNIRIKHWTTYACIPESLLKWNRTGLQV